MPRERDRMIRALTTDGQIRALVVNATQACNKAQQAQDSWPAATAALGRLISAAIMLAGTIKEGERISLQVEADGPIGAVYAQATPDGRVRGYLRDPHVNPPSRAGKLDVGAAIGHTGELSVIRDLGMREPYVGRVNLVSGEIGQDLAYYFLTSEQQPSAVGLGVLVETDGSVLAAGGYIVQPLPGTDEETLAKLEQAVAGAPTPTMLVETCCDPEKMLAALLPDFHFDILQQITPRFFCGCTRAKSRTALRALSPDDLQAMINSGESAHVSCDFCRKEYEFGPDELQAVLDEKVKPTK